MKTCMLFVCAVAAAAACLGGDARKVGAERDWTTYEAEDMRTTGMVLGPKYGPFLIETEASGKSA